MSQKSEREGASDEEPILDSCHIDCFISMPRLTDEEIQKYTKKNLAANLEAISIDHNYSASSSPVEYDSDATTVAEDSYVDESDSSLVQVGEANLFSDNEVFTIEIDRNTSRRIQRENPWKNMISDKLISKYNSMKKRSSTTLAFFCLFCLKEYTNVTQTLRCFYRQAKHFPYRCAECEEVTLDTKDMLEHFTKSHPTLNNIRYRKDYAPAKERWIHKFVDYQLKCVTNQKPMIPNSILHKYCPVCNQYDYKLSEIRTAKSKVQHKLYTVLDKNHIHKHLKYHPFQCNLCLVKGTRFDLTIVNRKARQHLINVHNFTDPTDKDLADNFQPTGAIVELERYINSYVKYVEEQFCIKEENVTPIRASTSKASTPKSLKTSSPPSPSPSTSSSSSHAKKQSTPLPSSVGKKGKLAIKSITKSTPRSSSKKKKKTDYSIDDMYYPDPKYSRKDTKGVDKKSPSASLSKKNSSVIDLDTYFGESISSPYLKKEQGNKIICFFCNNMQSNVLVAWDHYAVHLDYRPITCQLCQKPFPGPKAFQLHGADHVDHDSLPYKWAHDEVIEAWISSFVNSFNSHDEIARPEFACCCPVCCKKFVKAQKQLALGPQKLSYEDIRKHIYTHIRYQPFQCNICPSDSPIYVSDLEVDGARHLTFHQITSPSEIGKHFTKSRGIDTLDTFLADHFGKIRRLFNLPETSSADTTLSISGPVCDVALLFSSLQETLGPSTLNNILDKASLDEDEKSTDSNQVSSSSESNVPTEPQCAPSSTTSETNAGVSAP